VALEADGFAGISGQAAAVDMLRRAASGGRIAHAYAFVGPPGSGRMRTALGFARALVAPAGGNPAERIARGVHPDVRVIQPTPPPDNPRGPLAIRMESVRALERIAALKPLEARWKVFIMEAADRMTATTPQAFLKTLEEPPAHTVIVLILDQLRSLPATVLSRCQIVRFAPVTAAAGAALLPAGEGEERDRALRWLAEVEAGGAEALLRGGESVGRDRPMAERMVETWWLWYRDMLWAHAGGDPQRMVFAGRADVVSTRAGRASLDEVLRGLAACREAWQALQGNVSPRLTLEVLLSRLTLGVA
jgi:DNA polymerase-3 subunit delta'